MTSVEEEYGVSMVALATEGEFYYTVAWVRGAPCPDLSKYAVILRTARVHFTRIAQTDGDLDNVSLTLTKDGVSTMVIAQRRDNIAWAPYDETGFMH